MLLSVVVNLLSSINGTQSAPQAASPLVHHGGTSSLDSSFMFSPFVLVYIKVRRRLSAVHPPVCPPVAL